MGFAGYNSDGKKLLTAPAQELQLKLNTLYPTNGTTFYLTATPYRFEGHTNHCRRRAAYCASLVHINLF